MATFPSINPMYEKPISKKYRILRNDFGDGYSQRAGDGLNLNSSSFTYEIMVNDTDFQTIYNFLEDKEGHTAFDFTLPKENTAKKFICTEWEYNPVASGITQIRAMFEQVYDLD